MTSSGKLCHAISRKCLPSSFTKMYLLFFVIETFASENSAIADRDLV